MLICPNISSSLKPQVQIDPKPRANVGIIEVADPTILSSAQPAELPSKPKSNPSTLVDSTLKHRLRCTDDVYMAKAYNILKYNNKAGLSRSINYKHRKKLAGRSF